MRRTALRATWATALVPLLAAAAAAPAPAATVRAGFAPGGARLRLDGPGLALRQRGPIVVRTPRATCARPASCAARAGRHAGDAGRARDGRRRPAPAGRGVARRRRPRRRRPGRRRPARVRRRARRALPRLRRALERRRPARQRGRELRRRGAVPEPASARSPRRSSRPGAAGRATTRPTSRSRGCSRPPATACSSTDDQTSAFDLGAAGRAGPGASRSTPRRLRLRVFAGPRPADVLRRFTARDRPPAAAAAPCVLRPLVPAGRRRRRAPTLARAARRARRAACRSPRPTPTTCPAAPSAAARRAERARDARASTPPGSPSRPTSTR